MDLPDRAGGTVLPMIDARMPEGLDWDIGHVAYGWGNYAYSPDGAAEHEAGRRYPVAPTVRADKASRSVTFTFRGRDYGVDDWRGARFYVTTWDIAGEGDYRELQPRAEDWAFGGGRPDEPKILDQMLIGVGE